MVLAACLGGCAPATSLSVDAGAPEGDAPDACIPAGPELRDTMGNAWGYPCRRDGFRHCWLRQLPGSPPPLTTCGGRAVPPHAYVQLPPALGRIAVICQAESGRDEFTLSTEMCRPVSCRCDADCPSTRVWRCRNGLCQAPGAPLSADDVVALCLADTPWASTCEEFAAALEPRLPVLRQVAAACPLRERCATVPPECRQP